MKKWAWGLCLGSAWLMAGCATDRVGVLRDLPDPIYQTKLADPAPLVARTPQLPLRRALPQFSPQDWRPGGGINDRWESIVIHHSATPAGNAEQFDSYHRNVNHWDELGYHFVIGNGHGAPDGQIEVGPRWLKQKHGAHCKTADNFYNQHGIGICLVGDFEQAPPTAAQMRSLARLVQFLMLECDIPASRVVTHGGVTGGRTACPGRRFPLYTFRKSVSGTTGASVMP